MTEHEIVTEATKFPYGARLTLCYAGSIYCGICVGTETHDRSYKGYMILKYDARDRLSGHSAVNERGENYGNCWWIEYGAQIVRVETPFQPAGICDIL